MKLSFWLASRQGGRGGGREGGEGRTYQVGHADKEDLGHVHRHVQIMIHETLVLVSFEAGREGGRKGTREGAYLSGWPCR